MGHTWCDGGRGQGIQCVFAQRVSTVCPPSLGRLLQGGQQVALKLGHPIQFKQCSLPFVGLVETKLQDPVASSAQAAEVAHLMEKRDVSIVPPSSHARVGSQEVKGNATHFGSLRF